MGVTRYFLGKIRKPGRIFVCDMRLLVNRYILTLFYINSSLIHIHELYLNTNFE